MLVPGCTELALQTWSFLTANGRRERRKGRGKDERKRECLDKLTEQICRHHLMFFSTISYCKFLPPPTHILFHAHKHRSQPKTGGNGCLHLLYLHVSPLEIPLTGFIKEGRRHVSCRMDDVIAPSVCDFSVRSDLCRSDPCRSDCQD